MSPTRHRVWRSAAVALAAAMAMSLGPSTLAPTSASAVTLATDAVSLMTAAGCSSPRTIPAQNEAAEMGRCFVSGGEIGVAVFAGTFERDTWISHAVNCDGGRCLVVGPTWVAVGVNPTVTARIAARLGGRIV